MSKKPSYKNILEHPDREEIISKLAISIPCDQIESWLSAKYSNVNEKKFVIHESTLKSFQSTYLDFYQDLLQDMSKTKSAIASGDSVDSIELAIKKNPAYNDALLKLANGELNLDSMIGKLAIGVELRISQLFDIIQEDPNNINTKQERLFIDYSEMFGNVLDKYYKWKEGQAAMMINSSVNSQLVDRHISALQEAVRDTLQSIDIDASLLFLERLNEKLSKLKLVEAPLGPTTEMKIAEVKILNENINKKINENEQ
jgi:hypothetical protein